MTIIKLSRFCLIIIGIFAIGVCIYPKIYKKLTDCDCEKWQTVIHICGLIVVWLVRIFMSILLLDSLYIMYIGIKTIFG